MARRVRRRSLTGVSADNKRWSLYGAPWLQPVADGRKSNRLEDRRNKPKPLPSAATSCRLERMVRRGSTVRARQRALAKRPANVGRCQEESSTAARGETETRAPPDGSAWVTGAANRLDRRQSGYS